MTAEMGSEGAWSEQGEAWFPRSRLSRSQARTVFTSMTGAHWIEVRVLARYARWAPELHEAQEYEGSYWVECGRDEPGAFPVWYCE